MKLKDFYNKVMIEFRCSQCNRLLFKGKLQGDYHIETLCNRCKNINTFDRRITKIDKKENK